MPNRTRAPLLTVVASMQVGCLRRRNVCRLRAALPARPALTDSHRAVPVNAAEGPKSESCTGRGAEAVQHRVGQGGAEFAGDRAAAEQEPVEDGSSQDLMDQPQVRLRPKVAALNAPLDHRAKLFPPGLDDLGAVDVG